MRRTRTVKDRGSSAVEFCFSSIIWMPLLLGTILFGFALIQAIQVSQLSRDSGHMYAYGVDFTVPQNAALLGRLAKSLNIQQNSGSGAILLSRVTLITQKDCDAAGKNACPNNGKYVFTNFYAFGNPTYLTTHLGNPGIAYMQNGGAITNSQYLSDTALVATNFSKYLSFVTNPPQSGQYAYISEVTFNSQTINWSSFNNTLCYARTFF